MVLPGNIQTEVAIHASNFYLKLLGSGQYPLQQLQIVHTLMQLFYAYSFYVKIHTQSCPIYYPF